MKPRRPTRKSKLLAIAAALVGKYYCEVHEVIGLGVKYRFMELDGQPTKSNSERKRGVILIWCGADNIVHRAELGRS